MAPGGLVYHVFNRAVARLPLLAKAADYAAFERVLAQAHERRRIRILDYCIMPNHWYLILWPRADGELTAFIRWLTHTHTMRWHAHYHTSGTGHLYQGRFPLTRGMGIASRSLSRSERPRVKGSNRSPSRPTSTS